MTAKIAKDWFRANPRSTVTFHWRMSDLSQAMRESLQSPRTCEVIGHRAVFRSPTHGRSEIALYGLKAVVTDAGELQIFNGDHRVMTYRSAR